MREEKQKGREMEEKREGIREIDSFVLFYCVIYTILMCCMEK